MGIEDFHNHENLSYEADYLENYIPDYLSLKIRLLRIRDSASKEDMRRFFNVLWLHLYSLFENIWFGSGKLFDWYLMISNIFMSHSFRVCVIPFSL